ncbi:DUF6541 family protein [Halobellus sp. GM3]|uniref:DUF6541 family protein n=1 Tax=Halobellus sp. GM3 TaxID=3458410 RepID=UPI00403DDEA0
MTSDTDERLPEKAALTLGFTSLAVSIALAFRTLPSGYELSLYGSTPVGFWVGVAVALVVAVAVVLREGEPSRVRDSAFGLLTLASLSVIALPVLRSYHYYGSGDALSHLGWAREIQTGVIQPGSIVYPGVHLLSVQFAELAGLPVRLTLQLLVLVVLPLVFVASFVACAYYFTNRPRTAAFAAVLAVMFVPINNVSVHPVVHPSSQAILLLPAVLFALLLFLDSRAEGFPLTTPTGALLALVSAGYVFVHPQEAMTYLSMLVGIALLQFLVRRYRREHPITSVRPVYAHTVLVGALFLVWTQLHDRARGRFAFVIESLLSQRPEVLTETSSRGASLVDLGGSLLELYLKLFSVTTLVMILAGALVAALLLGRIDPSKRRRNTFIGILTAALVFPTIGFVLIFLAQQGDHYFRFHGFIMVTVSLLAAVEITSIADRLRGAAGALGDRGFRDRADAFGDASTRSRVWAGLTAVFIVLLALQLVVVHPSPYIYQPNGQVTETEMNGYDIAIQYHDGETSFTGVRADPSRYLDAHFGTRTAESIGFPGYESDVPQEVFNTNVTSHYETDRYLVVTEKDRRREVELYEEFRYRAAGFEALESEPGANRIQDNGGFTLYRLLGSDA